MRLRRTALPAAAILFTAAAVFGAVALDRVSVESLRANVTWLAADERQGRMTPSPGLEASADYIAAQFRQAGLIPGGEDGSWFQTAPFAQIAAPSASGADDFRMSLEAGGRRVNVRSNNVSVRSLAALDFQGAAIVQLPRNGALPDVAGRVVAGGQSWDSDMALRSLEIRRPALILLTLDGEKPSEGPVLMEADASIPPVVRIYGRAAAELLSGNTPVRITLHSVQLIRHDVALRNVAGILRGSDPAVRDRFVIVSAHYDHLGVKPPGPGNRIYHGANDDASGAASLIEIAKALVAGSPHPRRSVLFLAFFGEEEGLLGSAYYVRHPLLPLGRTIADINLEQLGRTDSSDGPEIARFAFNGPSFSDLPKMMSAAARTAGTEVYRKDDGDDYFDRSDNYSFALAGIVAHTIAVAFEFPGYHEVNDTADKIDYRNLATVDRAIAAGVAAVANSSQPPKWSEAPAARVYRGAAKH